MHQILKFYFKVFSILFVGILLLLGLYFKINGEWDKFICDFGCRSNSLYTQYLTPEKKVIGIYKINVDRCDCYLIHKDIEWIFRKEMEKERYDEKVIDKWFRRLYTNIELKLKGKENDRNTSITSLSPSSNSSK